MLGDAHIPQHIKDLIDDKVLNPDGNANDLTYDATTAS